MIYEEVHGRWIPTGIGHPQTEEYKKDCAEWKQAGYQQNRKQFWTSCVISLINANEWDTNQMPREADSLLKAYDERFAPEGHND